jgi:cysteine synthase A
MPIAQLQRNNRFIQLVAPTPLVAVKLGMDRPTVWCKLEFLNPSGSTKDRIARYILEKAWRSGKVTTGSRVIEASSGSTSIAFSLACAQMGLHFTAVMPASVSNERVMIIRAYGGDIILTPKEEGIIGALRRAEQEAEKSGAFLPKQFENPDNAEAHRKSTAQEILAQIPDGVVDAVVSGIGTGGTLVGLYQGLTESGCPVKAYAARPVAGPDGTNHLHVECCSFSVRIPGVVDGLSKIYTKRTMPDAIEIEIDDSQAVDTTRKLICAGFPVGPSSGLNYVAAEQVARELGADAVVVTVFPDRMERYFSTELFADYRPS